jgi:hypothetical protein
VTRTVVSEGARERKGWAAAGEGPGGGGDVAEEATMQPRRRQALADVRGKEMKRGEGRGAEVEAGAVAAGRREERSGAAIMVDEMQDELAAEAARDAAFTYSIVRPTAFFKSLGGQVEVLKKGNPYVMFGDGKLCACKPISEEDLASFIADCIFDEDKANKVLPIGGPGKSLTPLEQGEMLFRLLGREPKFIKVPIQIMDGVIWVLDGLAKVFPGLRTLQNSARSGGTMRRRACWCLTRRPGSTATS